MARLVWGTVGQRFYELGVDRGVVYIDGQAIPWSGLASVNESPKGGDAKAYYLDGIKYLNISAKEEFEATIEALYSPPEFDECDGIATVVPGMLATQQRRKSFHLCYRTRIGNDLDGPNHGYKIHILYNALVKPSDREYATISDDADIPLLSWGITTKPVKVPNVAPTSHLVIDTTLATEFSVSILEAILYGTEEDAPRLPDPDELALIFQDDAPLVITEVDAEGGVFTIEGSDQGVHSVGDGMYEINYHTVVDNGNGTATISSSEDTILEVFAAEG